MTKEKARVFSAEEKTRIVLEVLKEESPLSVIASKYEINSKTISNWKKQFISNAALAFEPAKLVSKYQEQINMLKEQNDELAKTLGKTIVERDWAVGKLQSLDLSNRKELVDSKLAMLPKTRQYELLKINRSSMYYKAKPFSGYNLNILNKMDEIYTDNPEFGYRYIHRKLLEDGVVIGKDRVLKYMNMIGIEAIYPKRKKLTSEKDKQHKIYSYLLDKYWSNLGTSKTVDVPNANEVWSGDITYVRTNSGFMYMAAIIDWHSRAVLSYKLSNSMDVNLVTEVLRDALNKYPAPQIFNSDQGSQYTSHEHIEILQEHNIKVSMSGKGRSIDNIIMERFFRTLKYNCIFINDFKDVKELKSGIDDYINHYNYRRFYSSIGYKKPMNVYLNSIQNYEQIAA
ncbi:IS3 family transposase [Candidatus Tisiphia endosymbiont of Sialis lutaria]|uniref:IS3 family transposase n=1 Tax=Candidatus Tisiphia endosymbiont of Sialis lutaria TaxID=2029164 RepID=UPI00312C8CBA